MLVGQGRSTPGPGASYLAGMRLLAIDTALEACSVGVLNNAGASFLRSEEVGRGHQERLFLMIAAVMAEAGIGFDALDRIAVTVGPGSFTGIRVGIAAARGFALVTKVPIVGVTTLAVHAESAAGQLGGRLLMVVLPARADRLYGQMFAPDLSPRGEPRLASLKELAAEAEEAGAMLAGSGAEAIAAAIGGDTESRIIHRRSAPDIAALLNLARRASPPQESPKPLYLGSPDARPRLDSVVTRR